MAEEKKNKWWATLHTLGAGALALLAFSPELIDAATQTGILKEYTLVAKLGVPLSILVKALGLKKQYLKDNLPSGLTKMMDKIPDSVTGVKGSKLPGGLSERQK